MRFVQSRRLEATVEPIGLGTGQEINTRDDHPWYRVYLRPFQQFFDLPDQTTVNQPIAS